MDAVAGSMTCGGEEISDHREDVDRIRRFCSRVFGPRVEPVSSNSPIHDLDLTRWKDYDDLSTSSFWPIDRRDASGCHQGDYHGNFVPQIPNLMMRRFSRKGDIVMDPFLGSGTTLIEARRLGRHAVGVELNPFTCAVARARAQLEGAPPGVRSRVLCGDAADPRIRERTARFLSEVGRDKAQLLILHPPYHDIIRFSEDPRDLSADRDLEGFLTGLGSVVDNFLTLLEPGRHLVLVMGDYYRNKETVPLGFLSMELLRSRGLRFVGPIIKNITGNRGKRGRHGLWRWRFLRYGLIELSHEYIFVFQMPFPGRRGGDRRIS